MVRRAGGLLAAATLIALTGGAATASAASAQDCDSVVVDQAHVIAPADLAELTGQTAELAKTTMLRLETVTSVPGGDLNAYEKQLQISCGWASAANVRRPRLLVIMVSVQDRQMGIYPGPALVGTITKPVWLEIEQDQMRPQLAAGRWGIGLLAGAVSVQKALSASDGLSTIQATTAASADPSADPSADASAGPPSVAPASNEFSALPTDANGNFIQGDGSAQSPYLVDPNGGLPGQATGSASGIAAGAVVIVALGFIAVIVAIIVAVSRGSSGAVRRRPYGPNDPLNPMDPGFGHGPHHGGFGAGGFDPGGGGGGGSDSGGGGSSSDGGGGSSGF
jgi:uncharacterized membrane protein YgcG